MARSMRFLQAAEALLVASRLAATARTASSLEMNSQTPSEAMIMNASASVTTCVRTSGSAMTPTFLTALSPMDRAIASPTRVMLRSSHTRADRPSPGGSETKPPEASMRCRSPGVSGFWSIESGTATRRPVAGSVRASTARESPALAVYMALPQRYTTTAVVPEKNESMSALLRRSSSVATKVRTSAFSGSVARSASASRRATICSSTNSETSSPRSPWPSNTQNSDCVSESTYGCTTQPRSWLIFDVKPSP
mmetsp:Transcript_4843/g.19789  ORF Transcript_4843/g.19789 Transcript_4843/m.19789 type:complete len:252 (-) Transcript_4843:187-942(-)